MDPFVTDGRLPKPAEPPRKVEQAVDFLMEAIPPDGLARVRAMAMEDLPILHEGLGQWIRDNFDFWAANGALLRSCARFAQDNGFAYEPGAYTVIVQALWLRLREKRNGADRRRDWTGGGLATVDAVSDETRTAARLLLSDEDTGRRVAGVPTEWVTDVHEQEDSPLFRLLVSVPSRHPSQVWELLIERPDDLLVRASGCHIRRVAPDGTETAWIDGCLDIDRAKFAVFCDHTVSPHRSRSVPLRRRGPGLHEFMDALIEEDKLGVSDPAAYFQSRLVPLATAVVEGFLTGSDTARRKMLRFSLTGPEWGAPAGWGDQVDLSGVEVSVENLLVPATPTAGGWGGWAEHSIRLREALDDHCWFDAYSVGDRPGGGWELSGWASWAGGTLLAASRCDYRGEGAALVRRMELPGLSGSAPRTAEWWLGIMRAVTVASIY